mgnify:CR=1 FL=1
MMRKVTVFLALLFLMPLFGAINVSAESDIGLEEAGITLVALRNDTLDLNQDGDVDARIRHSRQVPRASVWI